MTLLLNQWTLNAFYLAAGFYILALTALRLGRLPGLFLALGFAANLASVGIKLYGSWPMQAPHQEPFWLVLCLAGLGLGMFLSGKRDLARGLLLAVAFLALYTALFPKSDYLPFPRSKTVFAHLMVLLSALGKALFCAAGVEAALFLRRRQKGIKPLRPRLFGRLAVWGFIAFTLSLFAADTWSYLGWTSPVVWREYIMTSVMAVWFYYGAFLHLYLLKTWSLKRQAWFALAGLVLLFYFAYLPETGQFLMPRFLI